ncbi:MAG: sulfurtransferase TusA family protein [bacterium]
MATVSADELKRVGIIEQRQKDYFILRLRTVGGDLGADELGVIARVSQKYADGRVHLTTRQGVEVNHVHIDNLEQARMELEENGITLGACGPRGRGIVACPGSAVCSSGIIETKELAEDLDSLYFRREAPHKFKIGVSGCPNNCSKPVENDIGIMGGVLPGWEEELCVGCQLCVNICPTQAIELREGKYELDIDTCILCGLCIRNCTVSAWREKKTGYTLYLGGTMGKRPRLGTRAKVLIETKKDLYRYIQRAFEFYHRHGRKKERFGHTLDRIGVEKALEEILGRERKTIDLRGIACPMNYVKAKLAIEYIDSGAAIEFFLDEGEPLVNVTRSLKNEGHKVLNVTPEDVYFRVLVEKN